MAYFEEEEPITRLKEALDLNELRNPQGKGVEFEIDDNELNKLDVENETDLKSFDKNQVASNICLMSDEEDANSGDEQYISEVERLRKRMLQNENSDLTSSKDGGVLKQMKTPGIGGVIPRDALVKLHYNAYTDVGQPPYDSTRLRGQELKLRLGKGESIPGLELALLSMKKHEVSRFLIRHDYAYGVAGCPPRIPREATLIFDIEVLHFTEQEGVDDYYSLSPDERRIKLKYTDIEKVVKAENAEAKEYFQSKNYRKAFGKYKRAQDILEGYKLKNDDEEKMYEKQLLKVYVNCAICCHSLSHFGRTITYCNDALRFHKNCVKAHYFKGKALHSLGSFKDAKDSLQRARNLEPSNSVISNALQNLARSMKEYEIFEKNMYTKMFTAPSSDSHSETVSAPESVNQTEDNVGEEYGTCSDAFRALVKEHFEKFKQDSSMTEMSFPDITMTPAEIECLLETAVDLGMEVRQIGKDSSSRYEVYKKTARSG
uniref:peptidylprolyl isomerase n=1 Tax=Arion vulgaris TaxID=1028688 RepID=A0A0B6YR98_9EUPU